MEKHLAASSEIMLQEKVGLIPTFDWMAPGKSILTRRSYSGLTRHKGAKLVLCTF